MKDNGCTINAMTIPCAPGDKLGFITQNADGKWRLVEDTIREIRVNSKGVNLVPKNYFRTVSADEVVSNTKIFRELDGAVLTRELFFLTHDLCTKAETFINHMNGEI